MRATTSSRAATRSSSSFRLRRRPITASSISAKGAVPSVAPLSACEQLLEAGHLDRDGSRDLAVLSLAGRSQHRRRGGGDPLGLARQLEGRERRRHPILGDAVDDIADLEEGIESRGGRQHREGADPEESEQQAAAYAEAFKHRGDVDLNDPATLVCIRLPQAARRDRRPLFNRHVLATPPDVPYPALNREVALVVEIDRAQHGVEFLSAQ